MNRSNCQGLWLKLLTTALIVGACAPTLADEPGRGWSADFEKRYLRMIIDHHYSALRITELAAGTDQQRDDDISPMEGTSPTPRTAPVQAKAASDEIKSMARPRTLTIPLRSGYVPSLFKASAKFTNPAVPWAGRPMCHAIRPGSHLR